MTLFLIIINIAFTTIGQVLLKLAAINQGKFYLVSGYLLFLLVIASSFYLMKLIELKYFTVIMSLNYLTVYIFSVWIFKESINKNRIIGVALVMIGIIIFSLGNKV
jgi:small multidrug resistance pump